MVIVKMLKVKRPMSTVNGNSTSLKSDECGIRVQDVQSVEPGRYMLQNFYQGCDLDQQFSISLLERGNVIKNGYGPQGCNIDADTSLRFEDNTNLRMLHQLHERPHLTSPYKGRGQADAGTENMLRCGLQTNSHKQCNTLADKSIYPERMIYKLYANPQKVNHIVETGWVRGGSSTRNDVRQMRADLCKNYNKTGRKW